MHSHGTGGSHLGHHDTLAALARAGFVAAAVEHPRDNFRDDSGFATDLQLIGRPHHIVALIDGVLAHATVGPLVDRARIGMAGFSAGGYTTLLIAGAVPDFALQEEYRRAVPNDPLRGRADAAGKQRRKPDLKIVADPRVRAIFLMAPALGYVFDKAGLAKVEVPVRLYRPTADEVLAHPWNAERIAQMLPKPPEYQLIEGAGHYVFLPPCPMLLALRIPGHLQGPAGHRPRRHPCPPQRRDDRLLPPHAGAVGCASRAERMPEHVNDMTPQTLLAGHPPDRPFFDATRRGVCRGVASTGL